VKVYRFDPFRSKFLEQELDRIAEKHDIEEPLPHMPKLDDTLLEEDDDD
jgi:hypothetical protein